LHAQPTDYGVNSLVSDLDLIKNGTIIIKGNGVFVVNRNITITNSKVDNSLLNSGDNVLQKANWGSVESDSLENLIASIKQLKDISSEDKEDTIEVLNDLKAKSENGKLRPSILEKMWNSLPGAVRILGEAKKVFDLFCSQPPTG